jgi:Concanavalin A-like lectin/glucanases superfamily
MCQPHVRHAVLARGAVDADRAGHECSPRDVGGAPPATASRRAFLGAAGLLGAGALALPVIDAWPASASASGLASAARGLAGAASLTGDWHPDPESLRFTLAVMPDTQYMFDASTSVQPAPVAASFQYLLDQNGADNIAFLAHLGDITQNNGLAGEFPAADATFAGLDQKGVDYSVLAGNHDIPSATDDQRGDTPYLQTFGPQRFAGSPTFGGASPDGYNTYHVFHAAGRAWLVLAMDWRPSAGGFEWANAVIAQHPKIPVILTTHEIAYADDSGHAQLSSHGQQVWDELVNGNDQVFLTLNGHFWPPGRAVLANKAGNGVHVHIANYQNRYYGGAGMIRLYHFDLARNTIDVQTVAPWILSRPDESLNLLERQEIELTTDVDYFSIPLDFRQRFAGFDPVPVPVPRPARQIVIPGTLAYWRFDGHRDGALFPDGLTIRDNSGNGNHLTKVSVHGSSESALRFSADYYPGQPAPASLFFAGGQNPLHGAYLQTVPDAPLNRATLTPGYTFEAFFKLPANWSPANNSWMGLLSRWGLAGQAGKSGPTTDPQEPIATLSLSDDHGLQWAIYPLNLDGAVTNWGHELPLDHWWHVAVVNDGQLTKMYVDGSLVGRNPSAKSVGITTLGYSWLLGGYEYAGTINQIFYGWIGDVRIVNRPLAVGEFMIPDFVSNFEKWG